MRFVGLFITIVLGLGIVLTILKIQRPDMFYSLMITFNLMPSNVDPAAEHDRLSHIQLLPISDEKKQFLVQRTVFMGASEEMVELALGKPKQVYRVPISDGSEDHKWLYHFTGDTKPTVLVFESNRLNSAYRVSAHGNLAADAPVPPTTPLATAIRR